MQGDFAAGFYGVHTSGHFTIGGAPGGGLFASPGDPIFPLHRGQIGRTWWIWQNQDLATRRNAIAGDDYTVEKSAKQERYVDRYD
jgi:tyrosinase